MKTKRNYSLALLMAVGILATGCSDNPVEEPNGPVTPPEEEVEYGYFSLNTRDANIPGITRDGGPEEKIEDGSAAESKIEFIRIVLYDAKSGAVNYTFDYDVTTDDSSGEVTAENQVVGKALAPMTWAGSDPAYYTEHYQSDGIMENSKANFNDGIKTEAELVLIKNYKLLVMLNPTTEAKAATEVSTGMTYTAFYTQEIPTPNDATHFTGGGDNFFMTNFQGFVDITKENLFPNRDEAESKPVACYVDRAVAKVAFMPLNGNLSNVVTDDLAELSEAYWTLDRTNKRSYYMRNMAAMSDGGDESALTGGGLFEATQRWKYYAKDPNFDNYSRERYFYYDENDTGAPEDKLAENFTMADAEDETLPWTPLSGYSNTSGEDNGYGNWQYTLENTMDAKEQYEDVTTAAILRIDYKPTETALKETTGYTSPGTALDKYFVWTQFAGTVAPVRYVFTGAELDVIKGMNADDFEAGDEYAKFKDLWEFLTSTDTKDNNKTLADVFGTSYTGYETDDSKTTSLSFTYGDNMLTWNANATNYYRVLIRHFDDDQKPSPMSYGRYGVVRNNVYQLTLNKVSGPGDIVIPPPVGPDDKYSYLSVSIKILPWLVRKQDVEL